MLLGEKRLDRQDKSMITITHIGDFRNIERFLTRARYLRILEILALYGQKGCSSLSAATPIDSGQTASSWVYSIRSGRGFYQLEWINTHTEGGISPAILIQYGHGTRNGGYVRGRDYINPAMRPILDNIAEDIWKEVTSL